MLVLTKEDLKVHEPYPDGWRLGDGAYIPKAIKDKMKETGEEREYAGPKKEVALVTQGMVQVDTIGGKQQAIGRAVPVAWLLLQLTNCLAKGEWAIRMVAAKDGGIWIEGNSWNNDWPKIGTDP